LSGEYSPSGWVVLYNSPLQYGHATDLPPLAMPIVWQEVRL
jgi:hypothetical protein